MGLDDLIKHQYHHKKSHNHHGGHNHDDHAFKYEDHNYHGGHYHGHFKLELIRSMLQTLPHKKALLIGALIICVVMLILGIALLWAIFPLITQALGYVETNGIKSIVDSILPYVEKLWKGNG